MRKFIVALLIGTLLFFTLIHEVNSQRAPLRFGEILIAALEPYKDVPWVIPVHPRTVLKVKNVHFTSYNPERGQTDSSPCIGANGTNVCEMNQNVIRTIALSQDLVGRSLRKIIHYGDKVYLDSDNPQCEGVWQVEDTMNARYTRRGDLFQMTRATNTSCFADVYLILE